jgi:hypothetical protein
MPVSYAGEEFTSHNPDGSEIRVRGWGNQFEAVFESMSGYTVVKDPRSGFYHCASLSEDRQDLVPPGMVVGTADPETLGISEHLRLPRAVALARAEATHDQPGAKPKWEVRPGEAQAAAACVSGRRVHP